MSSSTFAPFYHHPNPLPRIEYGAGSEGDGAVAMRPRSLTGLPHKHWGDAYNVGRDRPAEEDLNGA